MIGADRREPATWIAHGILAVAAGLSGFAAGPLWIETRAPDELAVGFFAVFALFYLLIGFAIAGTLAHLFLRLALATERGDIATRMALGQPRSALVGDAQRRGWRAGLMLVPAAALVGVVIRQLIHDAQAQPGALGNGEFSLIGLASLALTITFGIGATTLAHLAAMAAITRESPASAAASAVTDAEQAALPAPAWRRAARPLVVGLVAAAFVVAGFHRIEPIEPWAIENLSSPGWLMVTKNIALVVATLTALWMAYAAAYSLARLGIGAGAALLKRSTSSGGRAIAADALGRLTGTGRRIVAVSAAIAALFASSVTTLGHTQDVDAATREATPAMLVRSTDPLGEPGDAGWVTASLDADRLAALAADERVEVLPLAEMRGPADTVRMEDGERQESYRTQGGTFAIDLDGDAPVLEAFRRIGLADSVELNGSGWASSSWGDEFEFSEGRVYYATSDDEAPVVSHQLWTQLPASFATTASLVDDGTQAPVSAAAVYPAGSATSAEAAQAVSEAFPEGTAWTQSADDSQGWVTLGGFDAWLTGIGFLALVALVVGLAATSVRLRRRDIATMAALGGSARSLAATPAWEAAVIAGAAYMGGTIVGIGFGIATADPFLLDPGAPMEPGLIGWHLLADLGAVPWTWLGAGLIALTTASGLVARVLGGAMVGRTPVEELRTAQKENVR